MRNNWVFFILLVLLVACTTPELDPGAITEQGIEGQALMGPMCPVMREDEPCPDQPYATTITITDLNEKEIVTVETDANGFFSVGLPPGDYTLHPENPSDSPFPVASPMVVSVSAGEWSTIVVLYDTGIR